MTRYEEHRAEKTVLDLIPAGQLWDFHDDPDPLHLHGVIAESDEATIFTGTKSQLRRLAAQFSAAVEILPDDLPNGSARHIDQTSREV